MRWIALLFLGTMLAGCVSDSDPASVRSAMGHDDGEALVWWGAVLKGPPSDPLNNPTPFQPRPERPECGEDNCERVPFDVTIPGTYQIAIEWEVQGDGWDPTVPFDYLGTAPLMMDMLVRQGEEVVADGVESFHYASVALATLHPGSYEVEVVVVRGTGSYVGAIRPVEAAPDMELLPDLVMMPPGKLTTEVPIGREAMATGIVVTGCGPDEAAESQDTRCLRFLSAIGNQGPGPFEANLQYTEATAAQMGAGGHWEQRIFHGDESRTVPIGAAEYHTVHGHYHMADFVRTTLYPVDEETGAQGEPLGEARKAGFCVIDGGLIDLREPADPPAYHGDGCCYLVGFCQLDMATNPYYRMGISANWYDIYPWWRSDQYVEISDVPDGTYELVSVVNPELLAEESDGTNNAAGTLFRLQDETIEILKTWTEASPGPHPDMHWDEA